MAQLEFKLKENTAQLQFWQCRNRVQGFVGGFGNGKTAILGVKSLHIALGYENARCLIGRATRPKLNDSTRKEVLKWTPKDWIKKEPTDRDNTLYLRNGSALEFRHVRQEGKGKGEETSNLLSNTYDSIAIDQLDDPELTHKDFMDLVGRLRGTARYRGDDRSMPVRGPQWLMFGANPTRHWLFRNLVNPYFVFKKTGMVTSNLLYDADLKQCLIDIYSAGSIENVHNTGTSFIQLMKASFKGSMYKRYVDGDWGSYEGLIYPDFSELTHVLDHSLLQSFIRDKLDSGDLGILESYDYGQTSPSCYLLAFYDRAGNIFVVDVYYETQFTIEKQAQRIKDIRAAWRVLPTDSILADPDIFRGKNSTKKIVGESVARMFDDLGIHTTRGNNNVQSGIAKVTSYLVVDNAHLHPVMGTYGAPRIFFSSALEWLHNEMVDYYWNKNTLGQNVDKPRDVNDHAMDALKYMLTHRPKVIGALERQFRDVMNPLLMQWSDARDDTSGELLPRHRA